MPGTLRRKNSTAFFGAFMRRTSKPCRSGFAEPHVSRLARYLAVRGRSLSTSSAASQTIVVADEVKTPMPSLPVSEHHIGCHHSLNNNRAHPDQSGTMGRADAIRYLRDCHNVQAGEPPGTTCDLAMTAGIAINFLVVTLI